jgi:hypothetical protein
MKKVTVLFCFAVAFMFSAIGDLHARPGGSDGAAEMGVRVGTFDSRGVALAYGRSARPDCMLARVAKLRRDHEQAKAEGDEKRVKQLELEGPALQERIHKQVFSGAPIDEILSLIEDDLPQIAEAANVELIVEGVLYSESGIERVDVTLEMCAPFEPDAQTLDMIKQIVATPPLDESELNHHH